MKKTCAAFLSLSLSILAALTPAAQAAQFSSEAPAIRVAAPAVSLTPSLSSPPSLPGSALPSLSSPELSQAPVPAPAAATAAQTPVATAALAAPRAAAPSASAAAATSAEGRLEQAGHALAQTPAQAPEAALNPLFENTGKRDDCGGSCGPSFTRVSDVSPALQPASVRPETADKPSEGVPPNPKSSFKRSAKAGFVGAIMMLIVNLGGIGLASMLGYHLHPGYHDPTPAHLTLFTAAAFLSVISIFAPVAEEVLFRYGVMGVVRKVTKSKFIVPAIVSSIIFAAVHELHDPVFFAVRFVGAIILARIYHKEGIAASMSAHGFFNGLTFLPVIASLAFGPAFGELFAMALAPTALYMAWKYYRELKAEAPARQAGRIVPFQITRSTAFGLAFLLALGFLFLVPTPVWIAGMIGWLIYASRHKLSRAGK